MSTRTLEDVNSSGELTTLKLKGSGQTNQVLNEFEIAQALASGLFVDFKKGPGSADENRLLTKDEIINLLPTLHGYLRFRGKWSPEETYYVNDLVEDSGWLMNCLNTTQDRAAPMASYDLVNEYFPAEEPDTLVAGTFNGAVMYGQEYSVRLGGYIDTIEVKFPTLPAFTKYAVYLCTYSPTGTEIQTRLPVTGIQPDVWTSIPVPKTVFAEGDKFAVKIYLTSGGGISTFPRYNLRFGGADPLPGELVWNSDTQLSVHYLDADNTDHDAVLSAMATGDIVLVTASGDAPTIFKDFVCTIPAVKAGDFYILEVRVVAKHGDWDSLENQSISPEIVSLTLDDIPYYQQAAYPWEPTQWTSPFSAVKGLLELDGISQSVSDDAFGVRVWYQNTYTSPDWVTAAVSR